MDDPTPKPETVAPAQDNAERCHKCGYNLTGLAELPRCPKCGERWLRPPYFGEIEFARRRVTLVWLNIATVGTIVIMLLIPLGQSSGGLFILVPSPPPGAALRLLLFPVQWLFALITVIVGDKTTASDKEQIPLFLLGFVLPLGTVGLSLLCGGAILRFEGI